MSAIGMPAPLLALFTARPPLQWVPPPGRKEHKPFSGLSEYVHLFEATPPPKVAEFEPPAARRERLKAEALAQHKRELEEKLNAYDPFQDEEKLKTSDPRKTIFVGRLSYETTEKKLLKTFEAFGEIRDIRLVADRSGKPRGYAFIEFRGGDSVWVAVRESNERILDGRKIIVDTEKARTKPGWRPRRLGGGEGPPRCVISKKQKLWNERRSKLITPLNRGGGRSGPGGGGGGMRGGPRGPPRSGGGVPRSGGMSSSRRSGGGGPPPMDRDRKYGRPSYDRRPGGGDRR